MTDLTAVIHDLVHIFDRLGMPYAIMGGIAARARDLLDVQDVLFTQGELDEPYLRRWAGPLGVEAKLDEVLATRE